MTCTPALVLTAALLGVVALPAAAQPIDRDVNINIHITAADYTGCSTFDDADVVLCENLASPPNAGPSFLWLVASRAGGWPVGIGGIEFGIEWAGLEIETWSLCTGGSEIPQAGWPASGIGTAITWSAGCYAPPAEVAKIGYSTIADGSTGSMVLIGDPRLDPIQALYADCDIQLFEICQGNLGAASLAAGTSPTCGDNCDGSTPVTETTWSGVKAHFD